MRISPVRFLFLILAVLGTAYVYQRYFANPNLVWIAVLLLFCVYGILMCTEQRLSGKKFGKLLSGYARPVDTDKNLELEPSVRGKIAFPGGHSFSRIAVDRSGIFIYKFVSYSFFLPWDEVKVNPTNAKNFMKITLKKDANIQFYTPWSSDFDRFLKSSSETDVST